VVVAANDDNDPETPRAFEPDEHPATTSSRLISTRRKKRKEVIIRGQSRPATLG